MIKLTVIVPVYNVEKYLHRCIDSILNQTFKDFELILVNDGSTDNSAQICEEYSQKDKRIKVIHKQNGGLSSARNVGLDIAEGEYIGFVDSDDYISHNMFNELYQKIRKHNADLAICNFLYIKEDELFSNTYEKLDIVEEFEGLEIINQLYQSKGTQFVVAWNKLYKKKLFNQLRYEDGFLHEDEYIIHKILYRCEKVVYSPRSMYYYVQRNGSIMNTTNNKKSIDIVRAFEDRVKFFRKINNLSLYQKAMDAYIVRTLIEYNRVTDSQIKVYLSDSVRKVLYLLLKNKKLLFKEKIAFIFLAISPKLYDKLVKG